MDNTGPNSKSSKKKKKKANIEIDEDELLDQLINENRSLATNSSTNNEENVSSILKVDSKQLDPDVEIRNLMMKNMQSCGSRNIVSQQRNVKTIGRCIKMKTGWPPVKNTGLLLDVFQVRNGTNYFRINHAESYRNQQYLFTSMRKNLDYESIMDVVLGQNPYHLESLLLLAQYYMMQEEPNKASDSIERALFALESASFKFHLISSEDQLDYNWRDNRVLFNLLWNQIQIMSGRRCFSTALEYAKILYGKNSEDPLATTLIFDALALKGKNYQFLVDFYEQFGAKRNLDMLPNFLYSTAYAYYCISEKSGSEQDQIKSQSLIYKAYIRFPFVLAQILDKLSIDAGPEMKKEQMFQVSVLERETLGIQLLVRLYLHHTIDFWKHPDQLAWLELTSTEFIKNLTSVNKKEVNVWKEKRRTTFVGIPLNIKRHLILCGLSVEDGEDHDLFDPYPPPNTEATYWPDKKLAEEIKQLSMDPQAHERQESGPIEAVIGHAYQFFRSIWPPHEIRNIANNDAANPQPNTDDDLPGIVAALDDQSLTTDGEEAKEQVLSQTESGGPSSTKNSNAETKAHLEEPIQGSGEGSKEAANIVGSTSSNVLQEDSNGEDSPSTSASQRP